MAEVIVIGGGVVGQSAAYQLARDGVAVTLDRPRRCRTGDGGGSGDHLARYRCARRWPATTAGIGGGRLLSRTPRSTSRRMARTDTGFAICGGLFVATNEEESAQLPEYAVPRDRGTRRAAGLRNIGDVALLDGREARRLFPPLADIPGAIHLSEVGRVNGRLLRDALRRAALTAWRDAGGRKCGDHP